jgi:hypothetical protein
MCETGRFTSRDSGKDGVLSIKSIEHICIFIISTYFFAVHLTESNPYHGLCRRHKGDLNLSL